MEFSKEQNVHWTDNQTHYHLELFDCSFLAISTSISHMGLCFDQCFTWHSLDKENNIEEYIRERY